MELTALEQIAALRSQVATEQAAVDALRTRVESDGATLADLTSVRAALQSEVDQKRADLAKLLQEQAQAQADPRLASAQRQLATYRAALANPALAGALLQADAPKDDDSEVKRDWQKEYDNTPNTPEGSIRRAEMRKNHGKELGL